MKPIALVLVGFLLVATDASAARARRPAARHPVARTITRVCKAERFPARVALGIAWVESRWNPRAVGDGGRSHGAFQIQVRLHNLTIQQARDVAYATRWTIRRIRSHRRGLWHGVMRHNGAGPQARLYLVRVKAAAGKISGGPA